MDAKNKDSMENIKLTEEEKFYFIQSSSFFTYFVVFSLAMLMHILSGQKKTQNKNNKDIEKPVF